MSLGIKNRYIYIPLIVLVLLSSIFSSQKVYAESSSLVTVSGQALVVNTGSLLSFSENNANVTISNATGEFSGYAWSETLGWADFANAKCDLRSGAISGYATFQNDGSIIDFNSSPYNSNVILSGTGYLSGYAWSETLGWINFTGVYSPLFPLPSVGGNVIYLQFGLMILTILAIYFILLSIKRRKTL